MIDNSLLAFATILTPIFVAILAHLIAKIPRIGNGLAKFFCVITAYATFLTILMLTYIVTEKGIVVGSIFTISLPIGNFALSVHVDYLALIPTLFSALFASFALTYSLRYLSLENKHRPVPPIFNRVYSLVLLFLGSMIGACFTSNMLALLIFWEITGLCSYALITFAKEEDVVCRASALKAFILLHIGGLGLLMAGILMYSAVGTWEIHEWRLYSLTNPTVSLVMFLLFIGALPKAVQFPFYTWLPDAAVAPTPVTAYVLHGGSFLMGLYVFPRFFSQVFSPSVQASATLPVQLAPFFGNISVWNFMIAITGAFTMMVTPLFALIESDVKRLIAYCHISAVGGTVMALGLGTPLAIASGLISMIMHVLFCCIIFFACGAAIYRTGKTSLEHLGGLYSLMPITAVCGSIGALSFAGIPFLGYFTAVWLGIHASLELNAPVFAILLFFGSVFKTAAILRMLHGVFFGKAPGYKVKITEAPALMLFPMVTLSACLLVFGVFPQLLLNYLVLPAISQLKSQLYSGLTSDLGSIVTMSGSLDLTLMSFLFFLCLGIMIMGIYASKSFAHTEKSYIKKEEPIKPFLCGEDVDLLDGARAYHFYHTLTHVVRIYRVCRAFDIDSSYNAVSKSFSNFCVKLLRFDIQQNYFAAFASFVAGALVIVLVAVLGG